MSSETEVWTEVTVTSDGVSVTLYSESDDDSAPVVEDEYWQTHSELDDEATHGTTVLDTGE